MASENALEKKITAVNYMYAMGIISENQRKDCADYLLGKKKILKGLLYDEITENECIKRVVFKCSPKMRR